MLPTIKCMIKTFNGEDNVVKSDYIKEQDIIDFECECSEGDGTSANPYVMNISVKNVTDAEWTGVIKFDLYRECDNPRFYMPGFMYGTNRGEAPIDVPRKYPRIRKGGACFPASDSWLVRGDRLSMPVCLIYTGGNVFGFDSKPYYTNEDGSFNYYAGYGCAIEDNKGTVSYTLGYENAPWLFIQSTTFVENKGLLAENCITVKAGETINIRMNVYDYTGENETAIHEAFKNVYNAYHECPRVIDGFDYKEAVNNIAGAISDYAWLEEDGCYSGFVFEHEKDVFTYNKLGSLSWTNGLSVAVPMLLSGIRTKNDKMYRQAVSFVDKVVKESMNEKSGLPYDAINDGVWSVHGWWFNNMHTGGHSAYLTGQAVYYILKAYFYEKKICGRIHDEWISFAEPVIAVFNENVNKAGEYPFVFSEQDGAALEYDSMSGAWCMAATAYYTYITGDEKYIDILKKSEQHYYDRFVKISECYGAPLDTDKAIDSEGILAYVRATRYLHEVTKDGKYISHMRDGLDYEFTFKFCYNSPVKIKPLSDIGWSSCGGSVTSTCNPHIHPMSSTVVDEMLYYFEKTKDEYVLGRLQDTVAWGNQTYNTYDGEYGYGKKGWMSERFCYSEGLVTEKYPDGTPASTWFALMPWAGASILEGIVGDYWDNNDFDEK